VKIAKTRTGSFLPSLLTPRRRIDVALHAVGDGGMRARRVDRKVDDLVAALGADSGDLQEPGLEDLRGAGHRDQRCSRALAPQATREFSFSTTDFEDHVGTHGCDGRGRDVLGLGG
jgi:hypothetical protein